ncbi:branched-chain amino acid ABC transporter integral membrane subunit [Caballeronia arationis]|jgi:branched-chain amino acid transport system permease protein|uniref:Amino acid/amide ABC transporter membrane protein 2, HAAT family n=1 Tax=Caballeronia arationis TaxID=1777142 RepID=A0A7Z7IH39_9BURK|nr:branched-chain amino acid ABC transporter permease [Caballeronia arationis]SAK65396.1 branched-chain amino acid ABC transporter integral membrane subunit [Caballeronia arationis]SOE89214.1 amino acid/amide ABC transporter membrane protein 2, HAAT family [Caballeronia arationis]
MHNRFALLVAFAVLAAAPWLGAYPVFLMKLMCFALFATSLNLLLGYVGLLSFGHAAFFGVAAYVAGSALRDRGLPPEVALLVGAGVGAALGFVMGLLAIRRKGIYFAMVTLALAQMIYFFCVQVPFTGGEDGMQGVPRGRLFGALSLDDDLTLYYVVLAVSAVAFAFIGRVIDSPFGRILGALKENEARTVSLGYDVDRLKLLAFVISAACAGLAGAMKTLVLGFATLSDVHWTMSGTVILMTLLGGLGTRYGPAVGAVIVVGLETKLASFGTWLGEVTHIAWFQGLGESVSIVTGVMFVACVLLFRRGIVGEIARLRERRVQTPEHLTGRMMQNDAA